MQYLTGMSDSSGSPIGKRLSGKEETSGGHGKRRDKYSSLKEGSSNSRDSSSQRESSRKAYKHFLVHDTDSGGESDVRHNLSLPSTSRDEGNSPPWKIVT